MDTGWALSDIVKYLKKASVEGRVTICEWLIFEGGDCWKFQMWERCEWRSHIFKIIWQVEDYINGKYP